MQHIGEYLDLYQMKTGSIRYCLNEIQNKLEDYENERLQEKVDEALKLNDEAARLEYDWATTKEMRETARAGTVETDNEIDTTLSAMHQIAEAKAAVPGDNEQSELAEELIDELFPTGVYPITSSRFEQQHMHVEQVIERLEEEFSDHVETLGLEAHLEALADLNETFGEQLSTADHNEVGFDEVEAARVEGRDAFHKVFVIICADYCDDDEARADLLEPIEDQQRRIERYVERRGQIPQVDPESGEPREPTDEKPEDAGTAAGGATASGESRTGGGGSGRGAGRASSSGASRSTSSGSGGASGGASSSGGASAGGPSGGESN